MLLPRDPRYSQMAIQASLILLGLATGRILIPLIQPAVFIVTALAVQWFFIRWLQRRHPDGGRSPTRDLNRQNQISPPRRGVRDDVPHIRFDWRSPLITALSLTLMLRVDNWGWAVLAAILAIGSKFLIRVNGKHLFNPSNFAIVALLLATDHVWVSPGQWGSYLWLFGLICCLGQLVIYRASRSVLGIGFLLCYLGLLTGRALWLGDPMAIPLHQLQNGALLIFSFFMISDPRATPDSPAGQFGFALLTAALALFFQFELYNFNHLFYALALASLTTPLWDRLFPQAPYQWPTRQEALPC